MTGKLHYHVSTDLLVTEKCIVNRKKSTELIQPTKQEQQTLLELKLLKGYLKSLYCSLKSNIRKALLFSFLIEFYNCRMEAKRGGNSLRILPSQNRKLNSGHTLPKPGPMATEVTFPLNI